MAEHDVTYHLGIVGAGAAARTGHIPGSLKTDRIQIHALADPDVSRAHELAGLVRKERPSEARPRVYSSLTEMLAHERLDGVTIASPSTMHAAMAREVLAYGAHVLIEKPLATSAEDAESVMEAARSAGKAVLVGMTHRFREDVSALKRVIDGEAIGRVYHASARLVMSRSVPRGWFQDRALSGGGVLWDYGVHTLDLAWYLMGRPVPETISGHIEAVLLRDAVDFMPTWSGAAMAPRSPETDAVEDFATALIRFRDGASLSLEVAWAANLHADPGIRIELMGTGGGVSLPPPQLYGAQHRIFTATALQVTPGVPFDYEMAHFARVMAGEEAPLIPVTDGVQVTRMLDVIQRAARSRREVIWPW